MRNWIRNRIKLSTGFITFIKYDVNKYDAGWGIIKYDAKNIWRWTLPSASPGNWGLKQFQFLAWIGLIWEILAHWPVHPAWNFGARLFCKKIPNINKNHISNISGMSRKWKKLISNISRMPEHRKSTFSNISRIIDNVADLHFQYCQDRNK